MTRIHILLIAALLIAIFATPAANAHQPSISTSTDAGGGARTFLASHFDVPDGWSKLFYNVDNDVFKLTLVQPLKEGDTIASMASADQGWSVDKAKLSVGTKTVEFPILATVKTSDGRTRVPLPATLKFKVDITAGEVFHSKGDALSNTFVIKAGRLIRSGDSIAVFFINGPSILSVEAADGTAKAGDPKPWFTAFVDGSNDEQHGFDIEAWRVVNNHVGIMTEAGSSKAPNTPTKSPTTAPSAK